MPCPKLPSPDGYGWKVDGSEWVPVTTDQLPAPTTILHLVKCGCTKSKCSSSKCHCKKAGLRCTDLCKFSDNDYQCENHEDEHMVLSDDCDVTDDDDNYDDNNNDDDACSDGDE